MEVHFSDNSTVISHLIMHLPLQFADGAIHTVEYRVVPALNHALTLGMPSLHIFNSNVYWKTHTIIC